MSNYLLEIGVEEFPAKHIKPTQDQFKNGISSVLEKNNYIFDSFSINSTPRRFSIIIRGIEANQSNFSEKVKGPSKKISFDEEGNPTKALMGFLKSKSLELDDITIEELNGEEYVYANIETKIKKLDELLIEEIPNIIKSISNPRQMRWGGKNLRFLRPIRWIVSILDDEVLKFELEGIKVSNVTKGHRTLGSPNIVIDKIDEYEDKLEENYVIVSDKKRRNMITRGINILSKEKGGNYLQDDELLEELIYINEYPTPFIGEFNNEYLNLPKEVIVTTMKDHQRYFPVEDDSHNLLPYFIAVRNGDEEGMENVIEGNKKVLVARLEDAKFFYMKDISIPLEEYVPKLESLAYYDGLGTMLDKSNRLIDLVETIGEKIECGEDAIKIAQRAAYLSKSDLVTSTVIEFTELQGLMGRIFAANSGEDSLVASAIEEQYMPVKSGGELPNTTSGILLSLAEKIDTITGLYSKGVEVTGSQDLYGQRRAVLGILHILVDKQISLDLEKLVKESLYNYVESFGENFDYEEVVEKVLKFIKLRFRNMLIDEGYKHDIIDSVLESNSFDVYRIHEKIEMISKLSESEEFSDEITKFVRVVNISERASHTDINEEVLQEEDRSIFEELNILEQIDKETNTNQYDEALDNLLQLVKLVDKYLDDTMVMVDDDAIRENRLAIVKNVSDRILNIFDPTKIVR